MLLRLPRPAAGKGSVKKLSGGKMVLAKLFDQRRSPYVEQSRRFGDGAVGISQRLADQSDLDARQMILEVDPAVRQVFIGHADLRIGRIIGLEDLAGPNALERNDADPAADPGGRTL